MRISLVLGSGGSRGYAQIGVIDELHARGHEVVAVSGASVGSLVGGALAAGRLEELRAASLKLTKVEVLLMFQPQLGAAGLVKDDRVLRFLESVIGDPRIEDLEIPYSAVAADLDARREVWFQSGSLLAAIRASISIPSVFSPVMLDGRVLADGGLLNPLPMEASLRPDADLTLAVSLYARDPFVPQIGRADADTVTQQPPVFGRARKVRQAKEAWGFQTLPKDRDLMHTTTLALDVMQERIQSSRIAVNPPDIHIEIPQSLGTTFDFWKAEPFIEFGRQQAKAAFDRAGI